MDANGFVKPMQGPLAITFPTINPCGQDGSNVPNKKSIFLLFFHSNIVIHPTNGPKLGS